MAGIRVTIADTTGEATGRAELPDEIAVSRLLPALLGVMNRPVLGPDGQVFIYRLIFRGSEIDQQETLAGIGVVDGDTLLLDLINGTDMAKGDNRPSGNRDPSELLLRDVESALRKTDTRRPVEIPTSPPEELAAKVRHRLRADGVLQEFVGRQIYVALWDLVSTRVYQMVQFPADVEMTTFLPALAFSLGLPVSLDGSPLRYELRARSGRRLSSSDTFLTAGIEHGDTLLFLLAENVDGERQELCWVCVNCGWSYRNAERYCPKDGTKNPHYRGEVCDQCGAPMPPYPGVAWCPKCGKKF